MIMFKGNKVNLIGRMPSVGELAPGFVAIVPSLYTSGEKSGERLKRFKI